MRHGETSVQIGVLNPVAADPNHCHRWCGHCGAGMGRLRSQRTRSRLRHAFLQFLEFTLGSDTHAVRGAHHGGMG
jgi:hypothetical protein